MENYKHDSWRQQQIAVDESNTTHGGRKELSLFSMDEDDDDFEGNIFDQEDELENASYNCNDHDAFPTLTIKTKACMPAPKEVNGNQAEPALLSKDSGALFDSDEEIDWESTNKDNQSSYPMASSPFLADGITQVIICDKPEVTISKFAPENEYGNCEYKLHLCDPTSDHLEHLTTQLKWRIQEDQNPALDGSRRAIYFIGVSDNGTVIGLHETELLKSVDTIRRCCDRLALLGMRLKMFASVYSKGVPNQRKIVKIVIKTELHHDPIEEIRITALGHFQSGKSTLLAVLTTGCLDNGSGKARMHVARHKHEIDNGRTSSVSLHVLEHDKQWQRSGSDNVDDEFAHIPSVECGDFLDVPQSVSYTGKPNMQSNAISTSPAMAKGLDKSKSYSSSSLPISSSPSKMVNLLDTAGDPRYFKSTIKGLCAKSPDFAMITMSSLILFQTKLKKLNEKDYQNQREATISHIRLTRALKRRLFLVVTKTDLVPNDVTIKDFECELASILACRDPSSSNSQVENSSFKIHIVESEMDAQECAATISSESPYLPVHTVPVFLISNVTGKMLPELHKFLSLLMKGSTNTQNNDAIALSPGLSAYSLYSSSRNGSPPLEALFLDRTPSATGAVLHIGDYFRLDTVGDVIEGWVESGSIQVGDELWVGPDTNSPDGDYTKVVIRSIHSAKKMGMKRINHGQSATLAISLKDKKGRSALRRGAVLISNKEEELSVREFEIECNHEYASVLKVNRQYMLHFNACTQSAHVLAVTQNENGSIICKFRFEFHCEYIQPGTLVVVRGSGTSVLLVGNVTSIQSMQNARRLKADNLKAKLKMLENKIDAKNDIISKLSCT